LATSLADVSSLIDIASSPGVTPELPTNDATPEVPELETPEPTETETPEAGEVKDKTPAEGDKPVDGRTNPDAIRKALKTFRDAAPENAPIARELNNGYGRYLGYKQVFPKVEDARNAKAILDAVGGNDGIAGLQETIKAVNNTDSLLYAGDPRVLDELIEDFKRENKLDAFGKLAAPFLDKLRTTDEKAYFNALKPHFYQGLVDVNLPGVLSSLVKVLSGDKPDIESARSLLGEMTQWFNQLRDSVETGAKANLDPERQAFERERTEFQTQKQKEFQNSVNADWNQENNRVLRTALRDYLKMPFAKNWTDGTKVSVAREITQTLLEELTADKTYQSQMDALWSEANPDKAKIINFHKSKVEIIGPRIVKQVLENRYPGFQRSAVPMKPKTVPGAKPATATAPTTGLRPTFVSTKPSPEQMDMEKDPDRMHLMRGRAFLKGSGKFVSWNVKDKTKSA